MYTLSRVGIYPRICVKASVIPTLLVTIFTLIVAPVSAQSPYTWNQPAAGTYSWDDPVFNWLDNTNAATGFPNSATDAAILGAITGNVNINLNVGITVNQLAFTNTLNSYSIQTGTAGTLTFGGTTPQLNVTGGATNSITAQVIGASALTAIINNASNFSLTNTTNTFTTGTTFAVSGGATLQASATASTTGVVNTTGLTFTNASSLGAAGATTVTLGNASSAGTLVLNTTGITSTQGLVGREIAAPVASFTTLNNFLGTATVRTYTGFTDFNTVTAISTWNSLSPAASTVNIGSQVTGLVNIATAGTYRFRVASDDGSRLYLDGRLVANNDGGHGVTNGDSVVLTLTAGYHNLRVDWVNGTGAYGLGIFWSGLGGGTPSVALPIGVTSLPVNVAFGTSVNVDTTANITLTGTQYTTASVNGITFSTAGSTLNINGPTGANKLLVVGTPTTIGAANSTVTPNGTFLLGTTTLFAGATNTLNLGTDFNPGIFVSTGTTVLNKNGTGYLFLDNTNTGTGTLAPTSLSSTTTINVNGGAIYATGISTGGSNPLGNAIINLNTSGSSLILDTKFGNTAAASPTAFDNAVNVTTNTTIDAVAVGGAITSLGSAANLTTIGAGITLTVNPYGSAATVGGSAILRIAPSGAGTVFVNSTGGGGSGALLVTGIVSLNSNIAAGANDFTGVINVAAGPSATVSNVLRLEGLNAANAGRVYGNGTINFLTTAASPIASLQLRNSGTGANTIAAYTSTGAITVNANNLSIDVNNNGANAGVRIQLPGNLVLNNAYSSTLNQTQLFTFAVTGGNTAVAEFTGTVSLAGTSRNVLVSASTGSIAFSGTIPTGLYIAKGGASNLSFSGNQTVGAIVTQAGVLMSGVGTGTASTLTGNVIAIGASTVVADNSTNGTSGFAGTVYLRNGAIFRLDQLKNTLPTFVTATALTAPNDSILAINVATYNLALTLPTNLYLGASVASNVTNALTPAGTTYNLGGGVLASANLTLSGTAGVAVLTGAGNSVNVGSPYIFGVGGTGSTVLFSGLSANTYAGTTTVYRGFTATATVGKQLTPFGTGAITSAGTITFSGATGSANNDGNTANNNAYTFLPGSVLNLDNSTAYTGAGSSTTTAGGRWNDGTAIGLFGTSLVATGITGGAVSTAETVGAITYDGASAITVTRNTSTGTLTLTGASLARTGSGTLRIVPTAGALNTGAILAFTTAPATLTGTTQTILNGSIVVENTAPTFASVTGSNIIGLATYSATALNSIAQTTANSGTEVVDVAAAAVLTSNRAVSALRVSGTNTVTGAFSVLIQAANVTNGPGGLIFNGTATHTSTFDFGSNAGYIYTASGATATISTSATAGIAGTGGFTKFGAGTLTLSQAAAVTVPTLSGGVTINEGTLNLTTATAITSVPLTAGNALTLNGGTLTLRNDNSTTFFASTLLRGSATINIDRTGGAGTGQNFTFGNLTVGSAGRPDPLTLTGASANNVTAAFGAVTLNQDLYLNNGRFWFNGPTAAANIISGAGRSIVLNGGAVVLVSAPTAGTNSFGSFVINNGTLQPSTTGSLTLGAPITVYGNAGGQIYGGATAAGLTTITDNIQIYSGLGSTGLTTGLVLNGASSIAFSGTATIGTETPTPLVFDSRNANNTAGQQLSTAFIGNTNLNFTSLTLTGTANGNATSQRQLLINQGTGTWNISGNIELNGIAPLHFVVPNVGTSGTIATSVTNLTTLRANAGTGQADFWFSTTGANTARIAFTNTYLDSSLRVDPTGLTVTGLTLGAAAHVSLGSVTQNVNNTLLWLYDGVNLANTVNAVDYTTLNVASGNTLRLTTNVTVAGNALLTGDQTATQLGTVQLTNSAGTISSVWQLATSGGLGNFGQVGNQVVLNIPTGTYSSKDNIQVQSGGAVGGAGLANFVINGPNTGPRIVFDVGSAISNAATGGFTLSATNLPANFNQLLSNMEFRVTTDINANLSGNNTALTATLGGNTGFSTLGNDGAAARTITSGNITLAGPIQIIGRSGQTLQLGGTVANNQRLNFIAGGSLPTGYLSDVLVLPATGNDLVVGASNTVTSLAGDYSGIRRFVVGSGSFVNKVTLQAQATSALGGTGTNRAAAIFLFGPNTVNNTFNPGNDGFNGSGSVSFQYGSLFQLDDAANVTANSGKVFLRSGSILNITNASTITAVPVGANAPVIESGVVARLAITSVGNVGTLTNSASLFVPTIAAYTFANALTLNRDTAVAWSGMLASSVASTVTNTLGITIGANGGTLASNSGTTLTLAATTVLTTNNNPLTIGNVSLIDGRQHIGGVTVSNTATTFGTSVLTVVSGATLTAPRTAFVTANNISLDGTLAFTAGSSAGTTVNVGAVTLTGLGRVTTNTTSAATVTFDSLNRTNNGLFAITTATAGTLGTTERLLITTGAPANFAGTGFAAPYFVNARDLPTAAAGASGYMTYSATPGVGFTNVNSVAFATATAADAGFIASTAAPAYSGTKQLGALVINHNSAAAGTFIVANGTASGTILQIMSGGIIVNHNAAAANTILQIGGSNTTLDFNGQEAVIFSTVSTGVNQRTDIASQIINTNGLTVGGGAVVGGNTAPVSITVAQAGTGWASNNVYVQSGSLRNGIANSLPTATVLYINGLGNYDLNNLALNIAGINGNGTLISNAATPTLTLSGSGTYTFDGVTATATIDFVKTGTGTQTFTNNLNSNGLRSVTVSGGTFNFNGNTTFNTVGILTVNNAAALLNLNANAYIGSNTAISAGQLNFTGNSLLVSNNASLVATGTGAINLADSGAGTDRTVYITGGINISGTTSSLTFGGSNTAHYVFGTTVFAQTGAGSNVNITGSYNVFNNTSAFSNNGTLTFNTGTISTFNATSTFTQGGSNLSGITFNGTTVFNGVQTIDYSTVSVGAASQTFFNNTVTFRGGVVNLDAVGGASIPFNSSGLLATVGNATGSVDTTLQTTTPGQTIVRALATGAGAGVYTIGSTATTGTTTYSGTVNLVTSAQVASASGGNVLFSGVISGGGGLTKTDMGLVTLSNTNTYTGATAVSAGRLDVTGSTASASSATVGSTGTLAGTGTVNGSVTINSGGTLASGNSGGAVGTLTIGGSTLTMGGTHQVRITGPTSSDRIARTTGTTDLSGGTLALTVTGYTPIAANEFFFILTGSTASPTAYSNYSEAAIVAQNINGSGFDLAITYTGNFTNLTGAGTGNDVVLYSTPTPEPTTVLLVCAVGAMGYRRIRRQKNA